MNTVRIRSGLLCLVLTISLLVQPVAASTNISSNILPTDVVTVEDVGEITDEDISLNTSEAGIALIKELEGFSATPYWDYSQYSVGYGTACDVGSYPNGITEEEADHLLRQVLVLYEAALDAFLEENDISLNQQQYDALVSFTYNIGASWLSSECKLVRCLKKGLSRCSDEEIMNAFGPWCHVSSGSLLEPLARRRIVEAQVFLYGDYTNAATSFYYVIFDANGGQLSGSKEDILYFSAGSSLDGLDLFYVEIEQTAQWESHEFCGWRTATYQQLTAQSAVTNNMTVYAMWDSNSATSVLAAASGSSVASEKVSQELEEPISVTQMSFTDVTTTDWFYTAVQYVVRNGLITGITDTAFEPEAPMTRAMFVVALANCAGVSLEMYGAPDYADVSAEDWYCQAVAWASQCGLVTGYTDGTFGPNDTITREQMCVLLYRFVQLMGAELPQNVLPIVFPDQSSITAYAVSAVSACQQAGIINGRTSGLLDPQGTATRCEAAQVLMNFLELYN